MKDEEPAGLLSDLPKCECYEGVLGCLAPPCVIEPPADRSFFFGSIQRGPDRVAVDYRAVPEDLASREFFGRIAPDIDAREPWSAGSSAPHVALYGDPELILVELRPIAERLLTARPGGEMVQRLIEKLNRPPAVERQRHFRESFVRGADAVLRVLGLIRASRVQECDLD